MAYLSIHRATPSRLATLVADAVQAMANWHKRRTAYKVTLAELRGMSERDLVDLGISRFDIPAIAREAAARV